jgi:hypothetical protein
MSVQVSFDQANARRLHRHGLVGTLDSLPRAAAAMAGVHAQIMSAAEVSLGHRVEHTTRSDVTAAVYEERSLVKTFGPRGTVHVLRTSDLPWWAAALGSVPSGGVHTPAVRLDEAQTDAVVAALDHILREGERTPEELDAAVGEACGAWAVEKTMPAFGGYWPRWRQVVGTAAGRGVLCFGPQRGRRVTYTSARHWLPGLELPDPGRAQLRLLDAYLRAYGPARPADLARWLATKPAWATALFERADLDEVVLDGEAAWVARGDAEFDEPEIPRVRLLPYFDAFVVGSQPRSLLFPGRASERALAGGQAGNFPVLLVAGLVGGVWHQRRTGRRVAVTVEPLGRWSRPQQLALEVEVERLAAVLEATPELTIGRVEVGPHA